MEHLKEPLALDESNADTSFFAHAIKASVRELKRVLGEPDYEFNYGEDKVNFEWDRKTSAGDIFTVYDWKEYRPLAQTEDITWHIGAVNAKVARAAQLELINALAK